MTAIITEQLRQFIGEEFYFEGEHLRLIDIIHDGPNIVLESLNTPLDLQDSAYGFFQEFNSRTYTIPVYSSVHQDWHPVFQTLIDTLITENEQVPLS